MSWIPKMDPKTCQMTQCQIPEPIRKFFWDRYIDRALSKLARSIQPSNKPSVDPPRFMKLDVGSGTRSVSGFCGNANITMNVAKIETNRSVPSPVCMCMCCGSALESSECPTCYPLIVGHKMGWCYFVVEHFKGQDYAVAFVNEGSFNYSEMYKDVSPDTGSDFCTQFNNDFVGPYVARNLNVSTRPMGVKRIAGL